jgi:hypothetical protein
MKQWPKHFIESNFGVGLYKGWFPRGMSLEFDRRRLISAERPVMFGFGANVGDTASEFAKSHPAAWIHAFDCVEEKFVLLSRIFTRAQ